MDDMKAEIAEFNRANKALKKAIDDLNVKVQSEILKRNTVDSLNDLIDSLPTNYPGCRRIYEKMARLCDEQKNKYILGLQMGGLMESPEWEIQDVREIYANSLDEAKDKWAIETGMANSPHWNKTNKTFWGWNVVKISS